MAEGSDFGSGFYTSILSPGVQPQSLSHGPLMTLTSDVPVGLGAERWDEGTVHYPPKLQNPKEENNRKRYKEWQTDSEGGAAV